MTAVFLLMIYQVLIHAIWYIYISGIWYLIGYMPYDISMVIWLISGFDPCPCHLMWFEHGRSKTFFVHGWSCGITHYHWSMIWVEAVSNVNHDIAVLDLLNWFELIGDIWICSIIRISQRPCSNTVAAMTTCENDSFSLYNLTGLCEAGICHKPYWPLSCCYWKKPKVSCDSIQLGGFFSTPDTTGWESKNAYVAMPTWQKTRHRHACRQTYIHPYIHV